MSDDFGSESNKKVIEYSFEIPINGGYRLSIYFKPKNAFVKLGQKLGLIKPDEPIVAFESGLGDHEYVPMAPESPEMMRGYFSTYIGKKRFQMTIDKKTCKLWEIDTKLDKLFS